ncbi:cupin domain [Edaphobacter aggregans]|uniref:Cupin domain n=1 Tax=Edaphobacter aggregans TaxID=570835 RepID=A0A3R9Q999_9BACT|nr:cupin domain-containing protein [Edaphobacter aggregans]RSL15696.1 cupin domain [Edaphobacter aggregans]
MIKQRDVAIVVIAALVGAVTMGSVMSLLHLKSGVVPVAVNGKPVIGESVYDWNTMEVKKTPVGESRTVLRGPTATLDELEIHVTTLNPGEASHPPHKHPNEELIILDQGTVEALINGEWKRVGTGSVIFNASNVMHSLRNVGDTPATYHVVNWHTDKTPKE